MSTPTNGAAPVRRPVVGMTTRSGHEEWLRKNNRNYLNRLADYGAQAVVLSPDVPAVLPTGEIYAPDEQGRLPLELLERLDGIIFSGGGDVDPRHFGQPLDGADEESIDAARDALELALGQAVMRMDDLPVFGICRGCQVLNVAAGGSMVQHVDGHRAPLESGLLHEVAVSPGSRLGAIVGESAFPVNTYHHQAVDRNTLAPRFQPAAFDASQGWLIEAYESPAHRWLYGVQWHPERNFELPDAHTRLWDSFIAACRARSETRA